MTKQSFVLDPEATSYTNDEIVGKINAAVDTINREDAVSSPAVDLSGKDADDLAESETKKYAGVSGADFKKDTDTLEEVLEGVTKKHFLDTEKTKLTGVEADAKDDQTGEEVRDLVVALADTDRKLVITDPETGEFKILAIHRNADGKLEVDYDDVAES
ncbi:hypothetical protein ES708_27736 [subsurface metagenome]